MNLLYYFNLFTYYTCIIVFNQIEIFLFFCLLAICDTAPLKVASFYLGHVKSTREFILGASISLTDSLV